MSDQTDDPQQQQDERLIQNPKRRTFLRNSAGLGLGFVGSTILGACGGDSDDAVAQDGDGDDDGMMGPSDTDILNFALNLEYLESEFYLRAIGESLEGRGIGVDGVGTAGGVTGGSEVPFETPIIQQYAQEIANDESLHVQFLRAQLGDAAVARPAINIAGDTNGAFTLAARAAGLVGPDEVFDPYADEQSFLLAAYIFEDVGVSAFSGAAPLIQDPAVVGAAAGILAAEAYHAGLIRTVLYATGVANPDAGIHEATVAISDARDSLDGSEDRDQGVVVTDADGNILTATVAGETVNQGNIVLLDENGLAFSRSAGQALNVVYLTAEQATQGGFFPEGVNGTINMSAMSVAATDDDAPADDAPADDAPADDAPADDGSDDPAA